MTAAEAAGAGPPPEVAWFAALCDDDYEHLGVPDPGAGVELGTLP